MNRPNHLDNFGTNLTSGTSASDTTSPVDSVPSIDAPFWVAFDATNINGHYERKLITSKTATNILHSALAYDHTTAEEVRVVNPAEEFDAIYQPPQGHLINGKIAVTDAAGITVAIKTLAGNDPSETDPVFVRIGDTVHMLTAALSVVAADGTNWCNAGSAELATKEVDYFVYLLWNAANSAVNIAFSRYPGGASFDDFSTTETNEKRLQMNTYAGLTGTDYCELIGRFAATLSAGAGYTWSVPTYTAKNLIQRPIYETRWLSFSSALSGWSGTPTQIAQYKVMYNHVMVNFAVTAGVSNATTATGTLPFISGDASNLVIIPYRVADNSSVVAAPGSLQIDNNANTFSLRKDMATGSWTNTNNKLIYPTAPWSYKI